MNSEYIEQRDGGYYITGNNRISLDSVVYAFNRGESPEQILEAFPLRDNLAKIYGAIGLLPRSQASDRQVPRRHHARIRSLRSAAGAGRSSPVGEDPTRQGQNEWVPGLSLRFQADSDLKFGLACCSRNVAGSFTTSGQNAPTDPRMRLGVLAMQVTIGDSLRIGCTA